MTTQATDSALPPVFHVYNRANDRNTLFADHGNYLYFLEKVCTNFKDSAHLLGYCIMPNHFHLLITPQHPVEIDLPYNNRVLPHMPTRALSEAVRRTLMGFTKGYNRVHGITGSRFQQHTKCKHHHRSFHYGLHYVHYNPVTAGLVMHPGEWAYSSYLEYAGHGDADYNRCNLTLGKKLLMAGLLH